jgi:PAS domain S-box-containing protein
VSKQDLERALAAARARAAEQDAADQTAALLNDLRVHELELEMQNLELREAHAELAASSARYADLYDSAPIPYCTFDDRGRIGDINLTGAGWLGRPRAELVGLPFVAVARPEPAAQFFAHVRRCYAGENRVVSELAITTPVAGAMAVQLISTPSRDRDGGVIGARTAIIDVTERNRAVEILRLFGDLALQIGGIKDTGTAIDDLARTLVPGVADLAVVLLFAAAGLEPRVAAAHALPVRAPAPTRGALERFPHLPGVEETVARVARTGVPELLPDFSATRAERISASESQLLTELSVDSLIVVPLTAGARVLGVLALATSRSGRRYGKADLALAQEIGRRASRIVGTAQLYGDAIKATQARDEILALVSHDLGGTAAAIAMAASALLERPAGDEALDSGRGHVELIRRSAQSMQHMVRDLLDSTLIEMGHLRLNRAPVVVTELLEEAIDRVRQSAEAAGVQIVVSAPPGLAVVADRERVRQVIVNLLDNALKFSDAGTTIRLDASEDGARVRFALTDEGPGILEADRERVFDAFWHGQGSKSAGLGLAIAKRIMDVHGERIWVETAPGGGATFQFTLPRVR